MPTKSSTTKRRTRRGFGRIEKRPGGRYRASYLGPDGVLHRAKDQHGRGITFEAKEDAESWLADRRRDIVNGVWNAPRADVKPTPRRRAQTFGQYATAWLKARDLKPRTQDTYDTLYRVHIEPTFGTVALAAITPAAVRAWHSTVAPGRPSTRAHAYSLLRAILATAVDDEILPANAARIRGAGQVKRARKVETLTLPQLAALVDAMPERHRVLTLMAAWCGLRFGELAELRRKDVDLKRGVVKVRRAVVTVKEVPATLAPRTRLCGCRPGCLVGPPKSEAGVRDVSVPPHILPALKRHMLAHAAHGPEGLVFPTAIDGAQHLAHFEVYGKGPRPSKRSEDGIRRGNGFGQARVDAGVPNLRWHDLRHTGATLAAQSGATLADLMNRLGHSTAQAAMIYQHASAERDVAIAAALSKLAQAVEDETTPAEGSA